MTKKVVLLIKDDDFKSLKIFGSDYFKNSFLKPVKVEKKIHYNKNYLQIARFADGSGVFGLDISESCRVVILGATRCLPKGTLVKTPKGLQPIENCDEVLSFNFDKGDIEPKKAIVHNSGKKKVLRIKTKLGVIECSPEHRWFVKRNGKIIVVEAKNLLKTDKLLMV